MMKARSIQCLGVEVGYLESEGTGPLVVFCHGNSASSDVFAPLVAELGSSVHAFSLDWYGHGRTPLGPGNECSVKGCAELLVAFVAALDARGCAVVGHSLGGHVAMEALPQLAGAIRGMVSISAPPFSVRTISRAFRDPVAGLLFQDALTEADARRIADALVQRQNVSAAAYDAVVARILAARAGVRSGIGRSVASGEFSDELVACRSSSSPLLFVQGRSDPFINTDYYGELPSLLGREANVQFIEGVAHCPQLEAPAALAQMLREFLAR